MPQSTVIIPLYILWYINVCMPLCICVPPLGSLESNCLLIDLNQDRAYESICLELLYHFYILLVLGVHRHSRLRFFRHCGGLVRKIWRPATTSIIFLLFPLSLVA